MGSHGGSFPVIYERSVAWTRVLAGEVSHGQMLCKFEDRAYRTADDLKMGSEERISLRITPRFEASATGGRSFRASAVSGSVELSYRFSILVQLSSRQLHEQVWHWGAHGTWVSTVV